MDRVLLLLTLLPLWCAPSPAGNPDARQTLLFVDDHHVLYRAGTERVLHHPVRHPRNPLIPDDQPWEAAVAWTTVYRDPDTGKYQLWYQAYGGRDAPQPQCVSCYADSDDGIHFRRPALGPLSLWRRARHQHHHGGQRRPLVALRELGYRRSA